MAHLLQDAEKLTFELQHFDRQADLTRDYTMTVYNPGLETQSVALYDVKGKRVFMKATRVSPSQLQPAHLFPGTVFNLYGRQYTVAGHADTTTARQFADETEYFRVKDVNKVGGVLEALGQKGINLIGAHQPQGESVFVSVRGKDARAEVRALGGAVSAADAIAYEAALAKPTAPRLDGNTTLCIIKPHAVREGQAGNILSTITQNGFTIATLTTKHLTLSESEEFYQVYKGVVQEYKDMVAELCSSPALVLEVAPTDRVDPQQEFRALCGPWDSQVATTLFPQSIRGTFGRNRVQNAVHCTDLPDDTALELEFFFRLLP